MLFHVEWNLKDGANAGEIFANRTEVTNVATETAHDFHRDYLSAREFIDALCGEHCDRPALIMRAMPNKRVSDHLNAKSRGNYWLAQPDGADENCEQIPGRSAKINIVTGHFERRCRLNMEQTLD